MDWIEGNTKKSLIFLRLNQNHSLHESFDAKLIWNWRLRFILSDILKKGCREHAVHWKESSITEHNKYWNFPISMVVFLWESVDWARNKIVRINGCIKWVEFYFRDNRPFALRGHVTSFLWNWKWYDFAFEKRLVGHILNKIIVIWLFKPARS